MEQAQRRGDIDWEYVCLCHAVRKIEEFNHLAS